jgi:hypothetical protein
MTKKQKQQVQEVLDVLDRKPAPLSPLERIGEKIFYLRRRPNVGVTIRLSHSEADALKAILPKHRELDEWEEVAYPFRDQIRREVRVWGLRQEKAAPAPRRWKAEPPVEGEAR